MSQTQAFKRPNILLLYTDQQRVDSLGCYGSSFAHSPNIDQLAREGVLFKQFHVNAPVCTPSRFSFLSGRFPASTGVGHNGPDFPSDVTPVNQFIKPYNYTTAQIGKLHFNPHSLRNHKKPTSNYGFDTFILSDEPGCYDDAYLKWIEMQAPEQVEKIREDLPPAAKRYRGIPEDSNTEEQGRNTHQPYDFHGDEDLSHSRFVSSSVCDFIQTAGDNPFFCIAGFYAPHAPVNPPKSYLNLFDSDKAPLPKLGRDEKMEDFLENISDSEWKKIVTAYHALCAHVDDCVGDILKTLEASGKKEDTLVIFTSDHGEFLGDHGRVQKGMPAYDCISRVPFIMRYPKALPAGKVVTALSEGVDFVPTILDFAGIQIPPEIQGKSLKAIAQGKTETHKDSVLIELFNPLEAERQSCVKTESFMYYVDSRGDEKLFDRIEDPDELENVIQLDKYQSALKELRLQLINKMQQSAFCAREASAEY